MHKYIKHYEILPDNSEAFQVSVETWDTACHLASTYREFATEHDCNLLKHRLITVLAIAFGLPFQKASYLFEEAYLSTPPPPAVPRKVEVRRKR